MKLPSVTRILSQRNPVHYLVDTGRVFRAATFGFVALVASLTAGISAQAQTTFGYNFGTTTPVATPTSGTSSNVSAGAFSLGNSKGTVTAPINTTSPSNGYTGASGGENLGNAVPVGALTMSTSAYYAVTLTPSSGLAVQLTGFNYGTRSTSTGPTTFALYSSVDNFTNPIFTDTGIPTSGSTYTFETNGGFTLTGAVGTAVTLELFTYGGAGTAGNGTQNNRIDDIAITADGTAVPEPTTCLAGVLMLGAMGWSQRRRLRGLAGLMSASRAA